MVIHAADVPTTQYEEVMKTDKVDAVKLARSLKAGLLRGNYVPEKQSIDDRSVVRIRKTIQKQLSGYKARGQAPAALSRCRIAGALLKEADTLVKGFHHLADEGRAADV